MKSQIYGGVGTPRLKRKASGVPYPERGHTLSSKRQRELTEASKFLEVQKAFENLGVKRRRPTGKLTPLQGGGKTRKGRKTRRRKSTH